MNKIEKIKAALEKRCMEFYERAESGDLYYNDGVATGLEMAENIIDEIMGNPESFPKQDYTPTVATTGIEYKEEYESGEQGDATYLRRKKIQDAIKNLQEKIAKTTEDGSWNEVDVDEFIDEVRYGKEKMDEEFERAIKDASVKYQMSTRPVAIGGDSFTDMVYEMNVNPAFIEGARFGAIWMKEHIDKDVL